MADQSKNGTSNGSIVEIKGVVLDAVFPNKLPDIYSALSIAVEGGELIDRLTLAMNRARQAQITQEILEIVAGADALTQ